jgi:hypothetical protein
MEQRPKMNTNARTFRDLIAYASHTMKEKYHSAIPATGMNVLSCIGNISRRFQMPHFNCITVATHQVIQHTHT